jgi:hypothetical protein
MSTFDENNPGAAGNRERPAPDDPEAQFYQQQGQHQSGPQGPGQGQHFSGSGFGYPPGMDPDGFAHQGWQGPRPGWQPWAGGYGHHRHRHFPFWGILLAILLIALLIKPIMHVAFALVGIGFLFLLILLPFAILAMIFRRHYGWRRGWHRGQHWGGPWGW